MNPKRNSSGVFSFRTCSKDDCPSGDVGVQIGEQCLCAFSYVECYNAMCNLSGKVLKLVVVGRLALPIRGAGWRGGSGAKAE